MLPLLYMGRWADLRHIIYAAKSKRIDQSYSGNDISFAWQAYLGQLIEVLGWGLYL